MTDDELLEAVTARRHDESIRLLCEFFARRRERYRDKLESSDNSELRGRAKECKDLLSILG